MTELAVILGLIRRNESEELKASIRIYSGSAEALAEVTLKRYEGIATKNRDDHSSLFTMKLDHDHLTRDEWVSTRGAVSAGTRPQDFIIEGRAAHLQLNKNVNELKTSQSLHD